MKCHGAVTAAGRIRRDSPVIRLIVPALLAGLLGCSRQASDADLTTVSQIRSAAQSEGARPRVAHFRGTLTLVDREYRTLIVENASGGLRVECPENSDDLQPGQLVDVAGIA